MEGNEQTATLTTDFQPLGVGVFNGISYIVSGRFDAAGVFLEGEIGTFPSPDYDALLANPSAINPEVYQPLIDVYSPLRNFSNSTVESILNADSSYTEPFRTSEFNFLSDRLVELEIQPSYDDSVNIIMTDDHNSLRLINSRFKVDREGKNAAIAERRQDKDIFYESNVYKTLYIV